MSPKKRVTRPAGAGESAGARERSDRLESKRQRFADERSGRKGGGLRPTTYITIGAIALVAVFAALTLFGRGNDAVSAEPLQQVQGTTGTVEGGRVSISAQEVATKKLVAWDYKQGGKTTPLLAYVTPSGALKVAIRMCEPCNGYSFRIEGNQIVCNVCGTRWDLESSRGISGGCQDYPPEVLPSSVDGGKIGVDEQKVATWKPRV